MSFASLVDALYASRADVMLRERRKFDAFASLLLALSIRLVQ